MTVPLIEIEGLRVVFHGDDGRTTHAVDRVDFSVANGATLGLVGESGCGKSVTSLAIMGLLSKQAAEVTGAIRFDGVDLLDVPDQTLRDLRGNRLAMIFQEPMTSLNPSFTIGEQIIETILRHRGGSRRGARSRNRAIASRPHSFAGAAYRRISAQTLGRNAPACHDRDGAGLRSDAANRRRAHHRARRYLAGPNP
jgi:peptide/nickel transport system ATP-binding protein